MDALAVVLALSRGPATLDALSARTRAGTREELQWAVDEAVERGWVLASGDLCGPDGICSTAPPNVLSLTEAGRAAASGR